MEELIGFIASNSRLGKILTVLDSKGPMDSATIAKTTRIATVGKNIEDLVGKDLISLENGKYTLTELGTKISHKIKGLNK